MRKQGVEGRKQIPHCVKCLWCWVPVYI